ncbi:MAG TPA: type II toxin-antitoxin system PemK/MazF family toxin [Longimicrobium sp.]
MRVRPSRGEVWFADLRPVRGHEQDGVRPVLVVSDDAMNHGSSDLAVVLPLTTKIRAHSFRVPVVPPEGGLRSMSFALCDQIRTVAHARMERRLGSVSAQTLETISSILSFLLVIRPRRRRRRR